MESLGQLLRELRGKVSIRDASKKIGISHTYLSVIERGYDTRSGKPVKPTPETLKLISKAYDYPYSKLMKIAGYLEDEEKIQVVGKEVELSSEELKILEEIKKHPVLFHDLANAPEKKIKQLIKMWEFIKEDLDDDEDDEDIIDD